MAIFRHPDGTHHRFPFVEKTPALKPIDGRPNWFTDASGKPVYVEPPRPVPQPP